LRLKQRPQALLSQMSKCTFERIEFDRN